MTKKGLVLSAALLVLALGCTGGCSRDTKTAAMTITGAGATFPYPLYSKWFYEYSNSHPGVNFNYQSIG